LAIPLRNLRQRAVLVPHVRIPWQDGVAAIVQPDNLVHRARNAEEAWIEEATGKIGEWRSLTSSVYIPSSLRGSLMPSTANSPALSRSFKSVSL
jgi:hypothetical protein